MTERAKKLLDQYDDSRKDRGNWDRHFDDIARVMAPRRLGFATTVVEGDSRTEDIYDGTGMRAVRSLANAVGGLMRPEGMKLATIQVDTDRIGEEAEIWLDRAEESLMGAMYAPRARFKQATGEADYDLVSFGTALVFAGESRRLNRLLFQTTHLKDGTPIFDDEGEAIGLGRTRKFSLREAERKFGRDALNDTNRQKLEEGKTQDKVEYVHMVIENEDGRPGALLARNLPFSDTWIDREQEKIVLESGFHEFPFAIPRWDTSSGENFGRSPGMIALPDTNTLQAMGETLLVAGQRAADPPLAVPNDGAYDAINTFPGGTSYYDVDTAVAVRGNPFFPLESGSNIPLTREMQNDTRDQIWASFFRNVLNLPIEGPQMTATEINARKEEFIREIGPVFGRLESDYTAPLVERSFNVMLRAGAFGSVPQQLAGRQIRFEYESVVKRIRKQIEALAAAEWATRQFERAQVRPEAADMVNVDALARFEHDAQSLPHEIMTSEEQVAAIRQARADELAAAQREAEIHSTVEAADVAASAAQKAGLTE